MHFDIVVHCKLYDDIVLRKVVASTEIGLELRKMKVIGSSGC